MRKPASRVLPAWKNIRHLPRRRVHGCGGCVDRGGLRRLCRLVPDLQLQHVVSAASCRRRLVRCQRGLGKVVPTHKTHAASTVVRHRTLQYSIHAEEHPQTACLLVFTICSLGRRRERQKTNLEARHQRGLRAAPVQLALLEGSLELRDGQLRRRDCRRAGILWCTVADEHLHDEHSESVCI